MKYLIDFFSNILDAKIFKDIFDKHFLFTILPYLLKIQFSDHFCAWVEEVIAPILKLEANLHKFPQCIADDIKRQVHELSTSVYQIRGYIKGRTLLPFPQVQISLIHLINVVHQSFVFFSSLTSNAIL